MMKKEQNYCAGKKKRCHNNNSPLQRPNNGGRKAQKQYDVSTMRMSGKNQNDITEFHTPNNYWGRLRGILTKIWVVFFFFK